MTSQATSHIWRFFRAGGFNQAQIQSGADLLNLEHLDRKLWAALACPAKGLEFDPKTLDLIDTDRDGRVRAPEILAAVKWACSVVKDPDNLVLGGDSLPLSTINGDHPDGKAILTSALQILKNLGKEQEETISIADTTDTLKIFAKTRFNGDGVVPADAAESDEIQAVINDIITCLGAETDRSGKPGITQAKADAFFKDAQDFAGWNAKSADNAATLLPLGDRTAAAYTAWAAVKTKIDDYFGRCRLAAFDDRAVSALNRQEAEYLNLAAKDLTITAEEIRDFPIARIAPDRPLSLEQGINPAWSGAVRQFKSDAVDPIVGEKDELTAGEWSTICNRLSPYGAWLASKSGISVEKLGLPRVQEILKSNAQSAINDLIAKDKALEPEANGIAAVDKLVRFHRDLVKLLNNFVNFRDFYSRKAMATFQAGTLYLDGRSCELVVNVDNPAKHAALAGMAKAYLAYCECTRAGAKMAIAAAFTGGDSDYLMVGRNGVFFDRQGRDWDATITRVVDNPISIRQAFWAPYKKLVRMIEELAAKRAAAAEAASDKKLAASAEKTVTAGQAKPAENKKIDVGTVAAMGVAFGALLTAIAALAGYLTGILKLPFWQVCLAFAGLLLLISGPSMFIAWLKLRQRNLGPILDANGWAINGRVRINVPFGGSLTQVAKLPEGARAVKDDPFAERPMVWPRLLLIVVAICFVFSLLNHFGWIGEGRSEPSQTMEASETGQVSEGAINTEVSE